MGCSSCSSKTCRGTMQGSCTATTSSMSLLVNSRQAHRVKQHHLPLRRACSHKLACLRRRTTTTSSSSSSKTTWHHHRM
jgi:hypothetical protein